MLTALVTAWSLNILFETTLFFLLYYFPSCRVGLPVFYSFVRYDLSRSVVMFGVFLWGTKTQYENGFIWSEPIDMILLCAVGIEAFGRLVRERPPKSAYITIIVCVLLIGAVLPHARGIVKPWMFTQRSLMAFTPLVLLLSGGAWKERFPDAHGTILFVFCAIDLTTYLTLSMYPEWAKDNPFNAPIFVMAGQAACMLAWTVNKWLDR